MLETERLALRRQLAACAVPPSAAAEPLVSAPDEECARLLELRALNRLITIDFPVRPRLRFGWDLPPHPQLLRRLSAREDHYSATLKTFLPLLPRIAGIPAHPTADPTEPNWINLAFPALDAIALYGLLVLYRPRRYIEIGSGFSTRFARRAIRDHDLPTRILSIDPEPRTEIDSICDDVVRCPLEDVPPTTFASVTAEDFIFIDGSHRAFQGSDTTVFFTEILPALPPGTLVGVHDIFLPADYPVAWLDLVPQRAVSARLLAARRRPAADRAADAPYRPNSVPAWDPGAVLATCRADRCEPLRRGILLPHRCLRRRRWREFAPCANAAEPSQLRARLVGSGHPRIT